MFTKEAFLSFYQGKPNEAAAGQCFDVVSQALRRYGILHDLTLIGALATVRVEVGRSFLPVAESPVFAAFQRYGMRYRGRGYIQLTWDYNYKTYGDLLNLDLLGNPDLALDPIVAADILACYFYENHLDLLCRRQDWVAVRAVVNGGANGLLTFLDIIDQYMEKVGNVENTINNTIKHMEGTIKWVKFFTTEAADFQTYWVATKTLQNDGQTHQFANATDALAKSTTEVFIFWDGEPQGRGTVTA